MKTTYKYTFILYLILCIGIKIQAQTYTNSSASKEQNYVFIRIPQIAISSLDEITLKQDVSEQVQYYDGLGRPMQNIQIGLSPDEKDIIQHIAYDDLGRESRKFLPYSSQLEGGTYRNDAETKQKEYYSPTTAVDYAIDLEPWSETIFEESPLNRVLHQGAPGTVWQPKTDVTDNSVHYTYKTNTIGEVIHFDVDASNNLIIKNPTRYAATTLYKTGTRDENGLWNAEYKDMLGQVVLKVADTTNLKLKTHYVYDDYGLLRYVLPPRAIDSLVTTTVFDTSHAVIKNLCYYYEYDGRKRMVLKKLPGADPVYMVYDKRDRLVLTQDGNQRLKDKWLFTKYDALNRPIKTGFYTKAGSKNSLQDTVDAFYNNTTNKNYESTITTGDGYTNNSFPDSYDEILSYTWYDNYEAPFMKAETSFDFADSEIFSVGTLNNDRVKGQVTGSRTKILDQNHWIETVNYYDDKYRPIQAVSKNYTGTFDHLSSVYDFVGKVDSVLLESNMYGNMVSIKKRYEYDHAGRLLKVYHNLNKHGEILMSKITYNELGQVVEKKLHASDQDLTDYVQKIDYSYNIRGWLKSLEGTNTDPAKNAFGMQLYYNNPIGN